MNYRTEKVEAFMTPMPITVDAESTVSDVVRLMKDRDIRHVPVQDGTKLAGLITERGVNVAVCFGSADAFKARDIMQIHPYTVDPSTPFGEVVAEMSAKKHECAIIQQANGKIVGILTEVDCLNVLKKLIAHGRH